MIITITFIRLRHWYNFFGLANHGRKITRQIRKSPGFVSMKNTGWGNEHYTLSAWESRELMLAFARTGAHQKAMKRSRAISTQIKTLTFEADQLPGWAQAKSLVKENGKTLNWE